MIYAVESLNLEDEWVVISRWEMEGTHFRGFLSLIYDILGDNKDSLRVRRDFTFGQPNYTFDGVQVGIPTAE